MSWFVHDRGKSISSRPSGAGHFSILRSWPFWLIVGFLVIVYGGTIWHVVSEQRLLRDGDTPPIELTMGAEMRVPEGRISPGRMLLFEYGARKDTRFVVRREAGNQIDVALAACIFCYRRATQPTYLLKGAVMCGMCRQPMRMPNDVEHTEKRQCDLVRIPYHRGNDNIAVPFDVVMSAVQKLAASDPKELR